MLEYQFSCRICYLANGLSSAILRIILAITAAEEEHTGYGSRMLAKI